MREKERRGNVTILLPHSCFKVAPCSSQREFLCFHFHILVGIFHYRTCLVYSDDGLPQMLEVFMSKQVGCTPTQFQFELSYTYSSSASVAWQSLLLALTSIDGHLHHLLISLMNVRLSPFCLLRTNLYHRTLFNPQCYIHGLRSCIEWGLKKLKRVKKYESIAWFIIGVVHDKYFVLTRWSMTRLYDFVGIAFFSIDILKGMIVCWDA